MHARRSLSLPAGSILIEMFMQGERVKTAKASGGGEFMVWNGPLEGLRACSASSVFRAKEELLGRGFLVELPGARLAGNGVLRSSWLVAFELEENTPISVGTYTPISVGTYTPISSDTPSNTPKSVRSRRFADSEGAPEYTPKSSDSQTKAVPSRARGLHHHQQDTTTTTNHASNPEPYEASEGETAGFPTSNNQYRTTTEQAALHEVALAGLRAAHVRNPEQVLLDHPVHHVLAALRYWVAKEEAGEPVFKPGGLVMDWLLSRKGHQVAEVTDLGFTRYWSEPPENVRTFGRGGR